MAEADRVRITDLRAFAERFVEAWRSRNPNQIAQLCAGDVVWEDPSLPEPVKGPAGAARHAQVTWAGFSDLLFEPSGEPAITTDKTTAYWPWRMIGTNDGPIDPPGFPATDRFIDVPGIAVWRFRGGKLILNRSVYDRADMARQLGLMPAPRSRAEQVYVTMAQLRAKMPQ